MDPVLHLSWPHLTLFWPCLTPVLASFDPPGASRDPLLEPQGTPPGAPRETPFGHPFWTPFEAAASYIGKIRGFWPVSEEGPKRVRKGVRKGVENGRKCQLLGCQKSPENGSEPNPGKCRKVRKTRKMPKNTEDVSFCQEPRDTYGARPAL